VPVCASCSHETAEDANFCPKCGVPYETAPRREQRKCEAIAQRDDFDPQARLRSVRARLLARQGDFVEAERLAREAVAIMASTDYLDNIGHAYVALADVLTAAGRFADAAEALAQAASFFERKGDASRPRVRETRSLLLRPVTRESPARGRGRRSRARRSARSRACG
jgi:hypothetical protein